MCVCVCVCVCITCRTVLAAIAPAFFRVFRGLCDQEFVHVLKRLMRVRVNPRADSSTRLTPSVVGQPEEGCPTPDRTPFHQHRAAQVALRCACLCSCGRSADPPRSTRRDRLVHAAHSVRCARRTIPAP